MLNIVNMTKNAIDDIDMKILAVLKAEGRISNLDLAERIGLSTPRIIDG